MVDLPRLCQVLWRHADQNGLLFLGIDILDNTIAQQVIPRPRFVSDTIVVDKRWPRKLLNVFLGQQESLILNNEQWPQASTSIRVHPQLLLPDVLDDRNLRVDIQVSSQPFQCADKTARIAVNTCPDAIHKDLCGVLNIACCQLLQVLHSPLFQELDDRGRGRADRNVRHKRQVLDQTAGLTLRSLCRTNHSPMSIVQLTRLGDLSISSNGSIAST